MRKSIPRKSQAFIFQRDQWICRYCGIEVLFSPVLKALGEKYPDHSYYHRNGRRDKMAKLLLDKCACVDHVNPVASGGENEIENMVCACWECNTKKSNDIDPIWLEEMIPLEKIKPSDGWDGMLSILKDLEPDNDWLKFFK